MELAEIEEYLFSIGFKKQEQDYIFETVINTETIINGQVVNNPIKREMKLHYLGEGSIDDIKTYGFEVWQEGQVIVTDYFDNITQIKKTLNM